MGFDFLCGNYHIYKYKYVALFYVNFNIHGIITSLSDGGGCFGLRTRSSSTLSSKGREGVERRGLGVTDLQERDGF
jgi:hypothetical protein